MFSIFRRRQQKTALNLYRIADLDAARKFDGLAVIQAALTALGTVSAAEPRMYGANYSHEWRDWDAFATGVSRLSALTFADVSFARDEHSLLYRNSLLNFVEPPELGSIHVGLSMPATEGSFDRMTSLATTLCGLFPFEYGYVHSLPSNVLAFTENKIRKTLLGNSVRVDRRANIWQYHLAAIRSGFLRSVYPVNVLNESHLANPSIDRLLQCRTGVVLPFVGKLSIWRLSEHELSAALEALAESGSLIWHESGVDKFLARPQAHEIHSRMSAV